MMEDILDRLFNLHSIKAIGGGLAGFGALSSAQVDQAIEAGGGNPYMVAAGIALYVVANLLRKA
jgi:hypothetical protein